MFNGKTIGFIGSGQMGGAMIGGLVKSQIVDPKNIIAADPHAERLDELAKSFGIRKAKNNSEAAKAADILVISTKPQVIDEIFEGREAEHCDLILSIAAGVTIEHLKRVTMNSQIVRAMPNTPAMIGMGMTVWTATKEVSKDHLECAKAILGALGEEVYVAHEHFMDAATALSGTGPAYVFLFMEALIDVGVQMGFSRTIAEKLVMQTIRGSAEYAAQSNQHPAVLRNQVTSPAGTTSEALYHMEKGGFRTVIADGVRAAQFQSASLGREKKI